MPNWCHNQLTVKGKTSTIKEFLKTYIDDKESFNFNAVYKLPKGLISTVEGGHKYGSIETYLTLFNPNLENYGVGKLDENEFVELVDALNEDAGTIKYNCELDARSLALNLLSIPNWKDIALDYISNLKNYGATTWYTWCVHNWGTKWNSSETFISGEDILTDDDALAEIYVYFDTAWDVPMPILQKICEDWKNKLEIDCFYLEESNVYAGNYSSTENIFVTKIDDIKALSIKCGYCDEDYWTD